MVALVLAAVAAAVVCWPRRWRPVDRVRALRTADDARAVGDLDNAPGLRRPIAVAAGAAVVASLFTGLSWWWVGALATAGLVGARARRTPSAPTDEVALAADLMAACLAAGATIADALEAATAPAGDRLRSQSATVVTELRRGAPAEQAWSTWLDDPRLAPVARACVRTAGSGAAVAAELARIAARLRVRQRALVQERVARASIWVVLPLGACFLPAFVAVGVVPLVLGLLRNLQQ